MKPTIEDVERLTKQNAMLMRALLRLQRERDLLAAQIAAGNVEQQHRGVEESAQ